MITVKKHGGYLIAHVIMKFGNQSYTAQTPSTLIARYDIPRGRLRKTNNTGAAIYWKPIITYTYGAWMQKSLTRQ